MSIKTVVVGTLSIASATVLALAASSAQAQTVDNANLAPPGVYFGTGNDGLPQEFTVNTEGGVEIALRSKISGSQAGQIVPVGNTYFIPLGDTFNFDYSVNPDVGATDISLANAVQSLTITNEANGASFTYDPSSALFGNSTNAADPGGYQNSEKASFGFLGLGYNPNLNDTFNVVLTLSDVPNVGTMSVSNIVQVGTGFAVPEPTTWALMIMGVAGVGASLRRARKASPAATA
jgi:hypothetical protein